MAEENIIKPATDNSASQARKTELVRPKDGLAYYYANHLQLGQTASDVRIVFGEITDVNEARVEVTQRLQVTMTWLQAKVLAEFVAAHVRLFEERNGPIQTEFAPLVNASPPNFPRTVEPKV